ncbi:MAG: 2Fe-2S iron-sulfur cluster-binding protein, partial [Opitutales bacterium]|nr:2Fe-2S iron-sulfur cluster-binding protein [Opitutales bacterium]
MSEESKKPQEVTINIDGKDYKVPAGMNLIDAVKKASGKEIPHCCYHPKLSVVGNCRMCMVEMGT